MVKALKPGAAGSYAARVGESQPRSWPWQSHKEVSSVIDRDVLRQMTVDQLEMLKRAVEDELRSRQRSSTEYVFSFEATADPRKGTPYVARLMWNGETKKIEREFYQLERFYGKKEVTVKGEFKARVGDIIERREGASWSNDHRYYYAVVESQEGARLTALGKFGDSVMMARITEYLKGERSLEDLLKVLYVI